MALEKIKFKGFAEPKSNFVRVPNDFFSLVPDLSLEALRLILYALRNTWGRENHQNPRRITFDEFLHGRRRSDGNAIHRGAGVEESKILPALKELVDLGALKYIPPRDNEKEGWFQIIQRSDGRATPEEPSI